MLTLSFVGSLAAWNMGEEEGSSDNSRGGVLFALLQKTWPIPSDSNPGFPEPETRIFGLVFQTRNPG